MIGYFQRNGAPLCAPEVNPRVLSSSVVHHQLNMLCALLWAKYLLDVIGAGATATYTTDWHQVWKDSPDIWTSRSNVFTKMDDLVLS